MNSTGKKRSVMLSDSTLSQCRVALMAEVRRFQNYLYQGIEMPYETGPLAYWAKRRQQTLAALHELSPELAREAAADH